MASTQQPWVIVVDDDTAVRIALQHLLRAAGLRVAALPSAAALLDDPRLHLAGCLVLDLQMPGSSGLDIQAALESASVDVPIVFLTAHGSVGASVQAMKHGAADFLEKPVDPPILERRVDEEPFPTAPPASSACRGSPRAASPWRSAPGAAASGTSLRTG